MRIKEPDPLIGFAWLRSHWAVAAMVAFLAIIGIQAAVSLYGVVTFKGSPISVVACTPESYLIPAEAGDGVWERGPAQHECDKPFNHPLDPGEENVVFEADGEGIRVAGQVCNRTGERLSYITVVDFVSVTNPGLTVPAFSLPLDYEPGCRQPYNFEFIPPWDGIREALGDQVYYGEWRIIGQYVPLEGEGAVYQWSATGNFELRAAR